MFIVVLGWGLMPRDGADPTDPSDRTGSLLERESVRNKDSGGAKLETGNLI